MTLSTYRLRLGLLLWSAPFLLGRMLNIALVDEITKLSQLCNCFGGISAETWRSLSRYRYKLLSSSTFCDDHLIITLNEIIIILIRASLSNSLATSSSIYAGQRRLWTPMALVDNVSNQGYAQKQVLCFAKIFLSTMLKSLSVEDKVEYVIVADFIYYTHMLQVSSMNSWHGPSGPVWIWLL